MPQHPKPCSGLSSMKIRGVINGKAGKAAALPKFSNMLTLFQPGLPNTLALPHLNFCHDYDPEE